MGLVWGIAARIWMRLISTNPEFSLGGTIFIVLVPTLFGACAGLAFAARQRGFVAWRRRLPQAACVVTFIPFGAAGGAPLMLNVLLATLALTQSSVAVAWTIAPLAVLAGTVGDGPIAIAIALPILAIALTVWKCLVVRTGRVWIRLDWWVDRLVQATAMLLAAGTFAMVCWEVIKAEPTLFAFVYVLYYVLLLVPLFVGLRMGLQRSHQPETTGTPV
jgi:hypothetical protein